MNQQICAFGIWVALPFIAGLAGWARRDSFRPWMALLGIPMAGYAALLADAELPRMLFFASNPFLLAGEFASLATLILLVTRLRAWLAASPPQKGLLGDTLEFLALTRWHPVTLFCGVALLLLPGLWFVSTSFHLFLFYLHMGWRALRSGDFQALLEGLAVAYAFVPMAGAPLLLVMHLLFRRRMRGRYLPWLLVPLFLLGAMVGMVLLVTMAHFGD